MILSFFNFTFTPIFLSIDDANFSLGLSFLFNSLSFLKIDTPEALAANKKIIKNSSIALLFNSTGHLIGLKLF